MRGACALAGLQDALVIDVGGTSSDVGILVNGFPRESATAVEVGGVRTNFRMPDLISIGLGGGTIVRGEGDAVTVGPDSVGYRVVTDALVMGGSLPDPVRMCPTKAGRLSGFGDRVELGGCPEATAAAALRWVDERIQTLVRPDEGQPPGAAAHRGGGRLAPRGAERGGCSRRSSPRTIFAVANAVGARPSRRPPARWTASYRYEDAKREASLEDAEGAGHRRGRPGRGTDARPGAASRRSRDPD